MYRRNYEITFDISFASLSVTALVAMTETALKDPTASGEIGADSLRMRKRVFILCGFNTKNYKAGYKVSRGPLNYRAYSFNRYSSSSVVSWKLVRGEGGESGTV